MLLNDQKPNFVTTLTVIRALGAFSSHYSIRVAHGYVIKMGFEQEVPVLTALLRFYSMFDMEVVWELFHQIPNKDVVVWSAMVSGCAKNEKYEEAIDLFRMMQSHGVEPNFVSVVSVLPACAGLGNCRLLLWYSTGVGTRNWLHGEL
uniref:Pentatricopeptide repeat-containing protein n=1 Tax=Rhizophora mucronata TaxID=61149 RepID=A0A2P2INC6_RHIMU